MFNPFSLEKKNIVITGAASGIGRQCAIDCSNAGANLILLDVNENELEKTKLSCNTNINCNSYAFDLTNDVVMQDKIKLIVEENGRIDGLIHAAGIEKTLPYTHLKSEDYQRIYDVNVISGMNLIKFLSKKNNRNANAKFVLISSMTSVVGRLGVAAYAASKGAIVSVVKTLALEMAPKGLNINCISPGTILTPLMINMLDTLTVEQQEERKAGFPLGLGVPSDVSNVAMFLLSDAARWITGQNLIVDGGYTAK